MDHLQPLITWLREFASTALASATAVAAIGWLFKTRMETNLHRHMAVFETQLEFFAHRQRTLGDEIERRQQSAADSIHQTMLEAEKTLHREYVLEQINKIGEPITLSALEEFWERIRKVNVQLLDAVRSQSLNIESHRGFDIEILALEWATLHIKLFRTFLDTAVEYVRDDQSFRGWSRAKQGEALIVMFDATMELGGHSIEAKGESLRNLLRTCVGWPEEE
jgi:hypothetical protein